MARVVVATVGGKERKEERTWTMPLQQLSFRALRAAPSGTRAVHGVCAGTERTCRVELCGAGTADLQMAIKLLSAYCTVQQTG